MSIPSPRGMIRRDSCLPHDTRHSMGTSGKVFESLPARDGPSSAFFENPKTLASSSCGLRQGNTGNIFETLRRSETRAAEFYNTNSTFYRILEETILKMVWWIIRDVQSRNGISEYSQTQWTFIAAKSTSRPKCVQNAPCLTIAMFWIKEVEIAKSVDDLMTSSQWIEGRDFSDFVLLDAKIASALERIISNQYFRRSVNAAEQTAQKYDRFLYEEDIWLKGSVTIFRATGALDAALDLPDLFNLSPTRRWRSGFRYKMWLSSGNSKSITNGQCSGRVYKMKVRDSVQLQTRIGVWTRNWDRAMPSCQIYRVFLWLGPFPTRLG